MEASQTIAANSRRAARDFTKAFDEALARIGRHPDIGILRLDLAPAPVRFWSLPRHRYVMVYDASPVPPQILRVVHAARDLPAILNDLQLD